MLVQFSLASLVLFAFPHLRPGSHKEGTFTERQKQQAGEMTLWFYLTRVGPCGAATGLDIGLGNMSLKFITLAFYSMIFLSRRPGRDADYTMQSTAMCKSSTLAFVLIFAFIFRLEKPTWVLVGIISIMTIGVIMMVASESETTFVLIGFILVMTASALSGLRWALTQVLLVRNPATSNPFSTIFFLSPVMFFSILCVAVPVEGFGPLFTRFGELSNEWGLIPALVVVVFPGIIAFLMIASEFALLQRSSVVTLSVAGIFKEILTISAATIIFGDPLTPVNISGLVVTIVSIGWYNWWKIQKMRAETLDETTHGKVGASGGYVAVGEEDVDTDVDENDTYEDRDEEDGLRRKRKFTKDSVKERSQNNQRLKGKGKATAGLHDQLLPPVSERDNENPVGTEEFGDGYSSTIGKQDAIPSGSAVQVITAANARGVRQRLGSVSSVDAPDGHLNDRQIRN